MLNLSANATRIWKSDQDVTVGIILHLFTVVITGLIND